MVGEAVALLRLGIKNDNVSQSNEDRDVICDIRFKKNKNKCGHTASKKQQFYQDILNIDIFFFRYLNYIT